MSTDADSKTVQEEEDATELQFPKGMHIGFSIDILHMGNKYPMQRGFFKNSAGNLLPALRFLDGLYNFCNFEIIFSLM